MWATDEASRRDAPLELVHAWRPIYRITDDHDADEATVIARTHGSSLLSTAYGQAQAQAQALAPGLKFPGMRLGSAPCTRSNTRRAPSSCAVGSRRRALFWSRSTVRANQSECSQRPFEEAELRKSPLEVMAALYVHPAAEGVPNRDRAFEALQTVMREAIEPLVCELSEERPQVDVRLKFPIGYPAEVLSNASPSAQLLIVGSHGGGGFAGMGLGSISNAVAHEAHCPVLVVRESARRQ